MSNHKIKFTHICIIIAILSVLRLVLGIGLDDTDQDTWHRSGLRVYRDAATGQEYLGTWSGHITPRLPAPTSASNAPSLRLPEGPGTGR